MNATITKRVLPALAVLIGLAVAGAIGYLIAGHATPVAPHGATPQPSQRKVLYWYDPMQPQQHFDHPGLSPMGMQMVPKYASAGGGSNDIVRIDPAEVQNLGMRTARVKPGRLTDTLQVPGAIAWDQRLAVTVSARTNATIEKLYVRAPFTSVKAGQPLATILAPQWSAAAAQYFALHDAQSATGRSLRKAARARLHTLGMSDAVIRSLHGGSGTITLRAPVGGVVSKLGVTQGQQVGEGMPIMRINGLDKVWIDAAIPQSQIAGVHAGTLIVASVSAVPGKTFHGQVEKLLPVVDARTRTQRARIVLDNPNHELAPGMFANVRIAGKASTAHPLVPTAAIIATGVHTRVIEALGGGRFKPVRVKTGRSADGMTAILAGLHGGERIVTSGQFLIDSEASLSGALARMQAGHESSGKSGPSSGPSGHLLPTGEGSARAMPGTVMPAGHESSGKSGPSSGPSGHLLPAGEGSTHAMPGMTMPATAATVTSSQRGRRP